MANQYGDDYDFSGHGSSASSAAFSSASCTMSSCATTGWPHRVFGVVHAGPQIQPHEISQDKQIKAEKKALLLFQNNYGAAACEQYRRNHLAAIKSERFVWLIGNLKDSYNAEHPFYSKPDVARVDTIGRKKLYVTLMCVENNDLEPMPYTDKVIALITHLHVNEAEFIKNCNRIREVKIKELPEHARI